MYLPEALIVRTSAIFTGSIIALTIYLSIRKTLRNSVTWYQKKRQRFYEPRVVLFLCQDAGEQQLADLRPRWIGDRERPLARAKPA